MVYVDEVSREPGFSHDGGRGAVFLGRRLRSYSALFSPGV